MKTQKEEIKHTLTADLAAVQQQLKELEQKIKLARGTADLSREAAAAMRVGGELSAPSAPSAPVTTIAARIEAVLRVKPHTLDELSKELKEPVGKVSNALRGMKKNLANVGTSEAPAWFWVVGDDADADAVNAAIGALVRYRPMKFAELLAATGVRQGRVSGAIVKMRRDPGSRITNLDLDSDGRAARWFVVPEGIRFAKLRSEG